MLKVCFGSSRLCVRQEGYVIVICDLGDFGIDRLFIARQTARKVAVMRSRYLFRKAPVSATMAKGSPVVYAAARTVPDQGRRESVDAGWAFMELSIVLK